MIVPNLTFFFSEIPSTNYYILPVFSCQFINSEELKEKSNENNVFKPIQEFQLQNIQANIGRTNFSPLINQFQSKQQNDSDMLSSEYQVNNKKKKQKIKTIYHKDQERNILPNALNKLFFFLSSKQKSQYLLKKTFENNCDLSKFLNQSKFYAFQKLIKSKMSRYKTEANLTLLFSLVEPQQKIFAIEEQLAFIKINAILVRNYIKKLLYFQSLSRNNRSSSDKYYGYLKKYRKILQIVTELIKKAKQLLDFELIQNRLSQNLNQIINA